jgi:osmoprotectant transport system permease protein
MRRAAFAAVSVALAILLAVTAGCGRPALHIGSKNFTESVILGEILRLDLDERGVVAEHRRALGGSAILWRALLDGSIDVYPEYTGTLTQELLHDLPADAGIDALRARLKPLGIGLATPLGFDDSYALGVSQGTAQKLGLRTISDLRAHPELRYGLSSEFLDRGDGWRPLATAYGLAPQSLRGLDHDLAYRALAAGEIDVVDLYTTDAEIPYYRLQLLDDDRHHFPRYAAVLLYRLDALQRFPQLEPALAALAGRIDVVRMQAMNAAVKLDHRSDSAVAAAFLGRESGPGNDSMARRIAERTLEHLRLVGISLAAAALLGLPLGIVAARSRRLGRIALAGTSIVQTIPALAMFVFLIPLLGIGTAPAIVALGLYSLLPIVRNTVTGLHGIDPALRESAQVLGLPGGLRLRRIELPLAARTIVAGLSTAAVINVGTATLGALIGAGGYGQPIITGIRLDNLALILEGAIPAALLALLVQAAFSLLDRWLAPQDSGPGTG